MICCPRHLLYLTVSELVIGFLAPFSHGSKIIFREDLFDAVVTFDSTQNSMVSALLSVSTMSPAMLERKRAQNFDTSTLRSTGLAMSA